MSTNWKATLLVLLGRAKWYRVFNSYDDAEIRIPELKGVAVDMAGSMVCMVRKGKELYAFENVCPHHQLPLHKGTFDEQGDWVCPYHRHCFDIHSGANKAMPQTAPLAFIPMKITPKGVFILSKT